MPTPPMLRPPEAAVSRQSAPDPLVALNVAGLAVVGLGLLIAAILAVYDWKTPGAEAPLVLWIAVVASALMVIDLALLAVRYVRRLRTGY